MSNRKELAKLIRAKDARLAPVAPSTVKGHADGERMPSLLFATFYERKLGLPRDGWFDRDANKWLDKAAPRPVPDNVYEMFDPLEAK